MNFKIQLSIFPQTEEKKTTLYEETMSLKKIIQSLVELQK
tara:strand:- start:615 stop:734 length:120 start_codon:yes stop_codon:yes gene_type:complete